METSSSLPDLHVVSLVMSKIEETLEHFKEQASTLLPLSEQWRSIESSFEMTAASIASREMKLASKERELTEFERKVGNLMNEMKERNERLSLWEKKLSEREEEIVLRRKSEEMSIKEMENRERLLESWEKEIDVKNDVLETRAREIDEERRLVDSRVEEIGVRFSVLESTEEGLEDRCRLEESRRKEVEASFSVLESREKEMDEKRQLEESREKGLERRFDVLEAREAEFDNCCWLEESRKKELERRFNVLEAREEEFDEKSRLEESRSKEIDVKFSVLEAREEEIGLRFSLLEYREKGFDDRCRSEELRKKEIEARLSVLESREEEMDENSRLEESRMKEIERRFSVLEVREKEFDDRCRLEESRRKAIAMKFSELETRVKEIDEKCGVLEAREVRLKQGRLNEICKDMELTQSKIKKWWAEQEVMKKAMEDMETSDGFEGGICELFIKMDVKGVMSYIVEHETKDDTSPETLFDCLRLAPHPAKLVLEVTQRFYEMGSPNNNGDCGKIGCIELLLQLMKLELNVCDCVRKGAEIFAQSWRSCLIERDCSPLEIFSFLQFVASFMLYDANEVLVFLQAFCNERQVFWPDENSKLCHERRLSEKISDLIQSLISREKHLEAVIFICAFQMQDVFSPKPQLDAHLECIRTRAHEIVGDGSNSAEAQDGSANMELAALRNMLKCIAFFKLEHVHSTDFLRLRIKQLEKEIKEREVMAGQITAKID